MTPLRGLSVPGWFLSVVAIVCTIVGATAKLVSLGEEVRTDMRDQNKSLSTRLCKIEYWVGAPLNKACDVSDFLVVGDDARVVPKPRPRP